MKEEILQWLHSKQHYETGVALYDAYGKDISIKRMLQQGKSPFRQKALLAALNAMLGADTDKSEPQSKIVLSPTRKAGEVYAITNDDSAPVAEETAIEDIKKAETSEDPFQQQWTPLFIEMNTLRHQLRFMATDVDRAEAAVRILNLREQCRGFWDKRDYFRRTGEMPPSHNSGPEPVADVNLLQKRLNNVATYITKARKALEKDQDCERIKQRLDKYTTERDEIVSRLSQKLKEEQLKSDQVSTVINFSNAGQTNLNEQ